MKRREFLAASIAASAAGLAPRLTAQTAAEEKTAAPRQFYQLRRYLLQSGPQQGVLEKYLADALIPAVTRRGMGPVGAFRVVFGPETPTIYVLIPANSAQEAATLELELGKDEEYRKLGEPFLAAPASSPAFVRMETELLAAFEGWPKLTPPDLHGKRIFQLRTYESPSIRDHIAKVKMFNSGEFDIFQKAGCRPVFFSDRLMGSRMPSLTYMLCFEDQAALEKGWNAFSSAPEWKKLEADPQFAFEPIVSNITNLVLSPLSCSQI